MRIARNELEEALDVVSEGDWARYVPYGERTLRELLAHMAGADQAWAVAAQGLLKGEATVPPPPPGAAKAARERAIERGRTQPVERLREEMERRRRLLLGLYELLEPRHLAVGLPAYGEQHNSVRERIWRGYHDRMHAADVRRALRMNWHPARLALAPEVAPAAERLSPDETLYVVHSVDPVYWEEPSPVPGWTYRQLLAHIATGDWVLQGHLRHVLEQGRVAPWPHVDPGNAQRLAERASTIVRVLVEEYLSMRHETMVLISRLEPRHLRLEITFLWEPQPNTHTILDYIMMFERHDRTHREQLRPAMMYLRAQRGGATDAAVRA
jgi:hypothetical protein